MMLWRACAWRQPPPPQPVWLREASLRAAYLSLRGVARARLRVGERRAASGECCTVCVAVLWRCRSCFPNGKANAQPFFKFDPSLPEDKSFHQSSLQTAQDE